MIKFKKDVSLYVTECYDEKTDTTIESEANFKAGELVDADIVSTVKGKSEIQYGDGSVSYGVPRNIFTVVR